MGIWSALKLTQSTTSTGDNHPLGLCSEWPRWSFYCMLDIPIYTVNHKKRGSLFLTITLA